VRPASRVRGLPLFDAPRRREFHSSYRNRGKTGTSHDGWFAGYTSNLLCIVWVGYDDYSDIRLSGAQTAAPIWAEFMKKAVALPQYADARAFAQPSGVVDVQLDKTTNLLATPSCPETYSVAFIAGTEPSETCDQGTGMRGFFSRVFGLGEEAPHSRPLIAGLTGLLLPGLWFGRREGASASTAWGPARHAAGNGHCSRGSRQKEKRLFRQDCGYL